ncbi:MAG: DNA-binding protein [Campylobacterales bacterium]|nr:DNA-binding protein [Campylobacterales bacterium]
MKKLTIVDAAEHFGISKEAIHNRIRRGSLNCVVENGVKYVIFPTGKETPPSSPSPVIDNRYTQYIENENIRLREKVEVLEKETIRLRDQREQMLLDERITIEQIYKERDVQLRSILHLVATKFVSHVNEEVVMEEAMGENPNANAINVEIIEIDEWVSLKSVLKLKKVDDKAKKKIKERFKSAILKDDERLTLREGKIFLNPALFNYSDLMG